MIDTISVFFIMFVALVIVAYLFRDKVKQLDKGIAEKLKSIAMSRTQSDEVLLIPTASYTVRKVMPSGEVLQEHSFSCSGMTLDAALNGVMLLKNIADNKKEVKK